MTTKRCREVRCGGVVERSRYAAGKTELLRLRRTRAEGLVLHWPFTQDPRRLPTVRRALVRGKPSTLNL
jgi:hypothetical protein